MSTANGSDPLRRSLQDAVGGKSEIIRLLGRGGMGAVYLARDSLARLVAIKVILPTAFAAGARERFRDEMRTVARFSHPNIVPIFASGENDELDYFVMPYVSGDSIAERLRQDGRMPAEEVRRVLVDLADALHYAHGIGVIHRDVKPANVMIDDMTGRAFLTDFGVAKALNTVTTETTGTLAGTIGYMPPEAFTGVSLDHRADIYSLGVLGYEMLAGRRPFDGTTPLQLIQQTVNCDPPDLKLVASDVPPDLAGVVMRCLAKDRNERPRDARRLRSALGLKEADETTMPDDLRDMAGFGSWTLLWVAVWGTFGVLKLDKLLLGVVLLVIALIVPTGFVLQTLGMRPGSLPLVQIARVAFWPPKWWGMWWPRQLRRPTDLWHRLPVRARLTRITLSAFLVVVPLMIFLATENDWIIATLPSLLPTLWIVIGILAAGVVAVLLEAWSWAHRKSLNGRQIIRMLIGPTVVSGLWNSNKVSSLLSDPPPLPPSNEEEPRFPRDCLHKTINIAHTLSDRSRESGARAVAASGPLSREIEALDVEISELSQDNDPEAIVRLTQELADAPENGREDIQQSRLQRSALKELERLRDVAARLDAATRARGTLFELHSAIWAEVLKLSRLDPDDGAAEGVRARIRRLCDRI
jgi:serine/threonine-protein kinase